MGSGTGCMSTIYQATRTWSFPAAVKSFLYMDVFGIDMGNARIRGGQNDVTSMDTPAVVGLIISLVDELVRRDRMEPFHLYVVSGVHGDDAPQVTADFVAAASEEQATQRVEGIRSLSSDGWTHDLSYLHLEDIRHALVALQAPSVTHAGDLEMVLREFGGKDCLGCQKPFDENDLDTDGLCADCRSLTAGAL
jgi:hypothetical protein